MAAPSMVFTARFAARHFDVDIDVIEERAQDMAPEEAGLSVIDSLDDEAGSTTAFTRRGLDYLDEFLDQRRSDFMHERALLRGAPGMDGLLQCIQHEASGRTAADLPADDPSDECVDDERHVAEARPSGDAGEIH